MKFILLAALGTGVAFFVKAQQVPDPQTLSYQIQDHERRIEAAERLPERIASIDQRVAIQDQKLDALILLGKGILGLMAGLLGERILRLFGLRVRGGGNGPGSDDSIQVVSLR